MQTLLPKEICLSRKTLLLPRGNGNYQVGEGLVVPKKGKDQSKGHGQTELKILEAKAGGKLCWKGDQHHRPRLLKDKGT